MPSVNAQTKMKALVVSRLLLGDINDWETFEQERDTAGKIANRHTARSVSYQIGRGYRELSIETQKFISNNFACCDYDQLARLCDAVKSGIGLYLRLDEFEKSFFPLAEPVKRRFPFHAHLSISTYGLQFEFPEHHFINDLEVAFDGLKETRQRIDHLGVTDANMKSKRNDIAPLINREKFISRSMVSASFSLVEAFLSGLFYTALHVNALGKLPCDEELLRYATNKESAPLKDRVDRIVKFASSGKADGRSDPFKSFIEVGKRYRDAIHHTTPFERKDLEAGQRLLALYEIRWDVALLCGLLSLDAVLTISRWINDDKDESVITLSCNTRLGQPDGISPSRMAEMLEVDKAGPNVRC
jgi:hypothetical protein